MLEKVKKKSFDNTHVRELKKKKEKKNRRRNSVMFGFETHITVRFFFMVTFKVIIIIIYNYYCVVYVSSNVLFHTTGKSCADNNLNEITFEKMKPSSST